MTRSERIKLAVGRDILTWRAEAGASQDVIARRFGWNRDAISKIETGKNAVSMYHYLNIAQLLRDDIAEDHPVRALLDHMRSENPKNPLGSLLPFLPEDMAMYVYDYALSVRSLRKSIPNHPALLWADHLLTRNPRLPKYLAPQQPANHGDR